MAKRSALFLGAALAAACGVKLSPPPSVFPVTNAWKARVDAAIEPPLASDGTHLFVSTRDGQIRALGLADGALAWRVKGRGRLAATQSALVVREENGRVRRLDPGTGSELWSASTGLEGSLPPVISGEDVLVAGNGLTALTLERGEKRWRVEGAMSGEPRGTGLLVISVEEDGSIRGRDRATGAVSWTFPTGSAVKAPVLVDHDHVLAGTTDGRLVALRLEKGSARWRWKVGSDVVDSPAVLGPTALFVSFDNILFGVGRGNGHLLWRGILPSRPLSGPILADDAVFVACQESDILAFDGRNGHRLGAIQTPAEIRTPPLVLGSRLFVGLRDRTILAFDVNTMPLGTATPSPSPTPVPKP